MPDFQEPKAHIWTMPLEVLDSRLQAPIDDPLYDHLASILTDQEIARSRLFRLENNRREYVAAHALCRVMLSQFSETTAAEWRFETGPHGRPEIIGGDDNGGLRFNISHTKGLVCSALIPKHDIGVDVEWTGRSNNLEEIAEAKFSKPEVALFRELAVARKATGFFSLWTLKEAYIKAIGKGLQEPLDGFAFSLEPLVIEFLNGQDQPSNWRLDLFEPVPDYLCALAVNCPRDLEIVHKNLDINELGCLI